MFLRYLQIENVHGLIRRIDFHQGVKTSLLMKFPLIMRKRATMWVRQLCCDSLISALVWREIRFTLRLKGLKS